MSTIPQRGRDIADLLTDLRGRHAADVPTHGGRTWAYVYDAGLDGLDDAMAQAHAAYASVNGLDPTVFPSIVALENEVVGAALDLLRAPQGAVGTFTSGGTESCMLAVKAARDARVTAGTPRIVVPSTVHAAFHKAGSYFGVAVDAVPVDPRTFRADPAAMAGAVTDDTVLVVCSAVSYAHGVCDPVQEIASAAAARGVPCHVDACIGGWLMGWYRRVGLPVPEFDFAVPGVSSISMDLHKYAYAAKGASTLLFADPALRRASYFSSSAWPGYSMINTTMQSTKSAGPLAAAWTALQYIGADGYAELARRTWQATQDLRAGIAELPQLRVLGDVDAGLVAVAARGQEDGHQGDDGVDVYVVVDELRERGWYVQPQMAFDHLPRNVHLTVTAASPPRVPQLLADLRAAVDAAASAPSARPDPALVAMATSLDPSAFTAEQFAGLLAFAGLDPAAVSGSGLPARMARVNHLLEALPVPLRERVLAEFLGLLYAPAR